jgi:general stress protein YciG
MTNDNQNQNNAPETAATTEPSTPVAEKPRKLRGFAAMDPQLVSELAKRGGKAAHRAGTAHQFTSDEARLAGRKGGMATHAKRRDKEPGVSH